MCERQPPSTHDYIRDGRAIYERSFAIVSEEADLARFSAIEQHIVIRMIHSCGMVALAERVQFSHDMARIAHAALQHGAPLLCDAEMVERGITRARLPANNEVICTLRDPQTPALATNIGNTRSAAAMHLWGERLAGAVVVIGNAPTALFHLLECLEAGAPRPAAIIGVPVGFVGAAESKQALAESALNIPYLIVEGRLGGSAIASGAVNALTSTAL